MGLYYSKSHLYSKEINVNISSTIQFGICYFQIFIYYCIQVRNYIKSKQPFETISKLSIKTFFKLCNNALFVRLLYKNNNIKDVLYT